MTTRADGETERQTEAVLVCIGCRVAWLPIRPAASNPVLWPDDDCPQHGRSAVAEAARVAWRARVERILKGGAP